MRYKLTNASAWIYKTTLKAYEDNGIEYDEGRALLTRVPFTYYDEKTIYIRSEIKKCGFSWSKKRTMTCGMSIKVENSSINNGYLVLDLKDALINDFGLVGVESVKGIILDAGLYFLYKDKYTYFINEIRSALGKGTIGDSAIR